MKKILMMLMICLGVSIIANAENVKRSCPVYDSDFTVELKNGSTLVEANVYGHATVNFRLYAPKVSTEDVIVYINLLDRTTKCVVATESTFVKIIGKSSEDGVVTFTDLESGKQYLVSIDSASCQ